MYIHVYVCDCACIILYVIFRDFEALSPNCIKENNRLVCVNVSIIIVYIKNRCSFAALCVLGV